MATQVSNLIFGQLREKNWKQLLRVDWTFPLNFVEIISGDGKEVYRERIPLTDTEAFGRQSYTFEVNLKGRTWVRVEVWDVAANGAFTQFVWLE